MQIIIAGAGDVGFHLAKLLVGEQHDIVLIDVDSDKLRMAAAHLDVITVKGSSTSYRILEESNVKEADLLISATSSEETNISTAIIAKHLGAKRTIARISNTEFIHHREKLDLRRLGIDEIVSPESLAAREIKRLLKQSAFTDNFEFEGGKLTLLGAIMGESSPMVGKTMTDLAQMNPKQDYVAVAILRNNKTIIPRGNTRFEVDDHAYFLAQPEGHERILKICNQKAVGIRDIMILGGSRVGVNAASSLSKRFRVKLVEKDKEKCYELAEQLPQTMIVNGDGRDTDLMNEEGIGKMDAFISVTGNSETNIITCLMAKNLGVNKTVCLVENMDYIHLSQSIGVDTMINKKLIAANFTFRYIREGEVVSLTGLHGVDAEVVEFIVKDGSKITKDELRKLHFPEDAVIGGVIRRGEPLSPNGDFRFQVKDRVVVLSKKQGMRKVEAFFK